MESLKIDQSKHKLRLADRLEIYNCLFDVIGTNQSLYNKYKQLNFHTSINKIISSKT
jgi:hypothetical protein